MAMQGSVLIVDDEPFIRQILLRTVVRAGFAGDEAGDGHEALSKMADRSFDMVITDIQMPNMDGYQLLAEIREKHPDTIVILISGHKSLPPSESGNHRADSFISKPFHNVEIGQKLQLLYQNRQLRAARAARAKQTAAAKKTPAKSAAPKKN